jgi:hypothetical protein
VGTRRARPPSRASDGPSSVRALAPGALAALVLSACGSTAPSPAPAAAEPALACIGIKALECRAVAGLVVTSVRATRDAPFDVLVRLYQCEADAPCAETLDDRVGSATVEWTDGGEPVMVGLAGPAADPVIDRQQVGWSGLQTASSRRAQGVGPFPFEIGHCGLTWMVDFDGSFWIPTGEIDGVAMDASDNQSGQMRLVGPNRARFTAPSGFVVDLIRFPGRKHVWLCR